MRLRAMAAGRFLSRPRLFSTASILTVMSTVPEPPLPSEAPERAGTYSRKMRGRDGLFVGKDVVPLWVADMDFSAPRPVVDAVIERAKHGIYGYTDCPDELTHLLAGRLQSVYGCTAPQPEWFRWLPGLISGLHHAVRATCSAPSDVVAIPTPIYAPFLTSPASNGAQLAKVPLSATTDAGGEMVFTPDWAALEAVCAQPSTRLLHWCNPHNPVGRCWTRAELARVARLCVAHDVTLCSDEVCRDLYRPVYSLSMIALRGVRAL